MSEEDEPKAKRLDTRASPTSEESVLPESTQEEMGEDEWVDWLSPEQANLLEDEISSLKSKLSGLTADLTLQTNSLNISQSLVGRLQTENARLSQQLKEKASEIAQVSTKLAEKERNEKHVVAQIANATAQAKAAAKAQYAPLVALSRTIAVAAGHIIEGSGPQSANKPNDARGVPVPESASWKDMPQAPVTPDNLCDWRRWAAEQPSHTIDMKTLVSLLNSPGFTSALRANTLEENPQECYACGDPLSESNAAVSKKGRHRKSHLDANGNITGVASGECAEGLSGTCGGCLSHGLKDTKHALKMCPLKVSTVMDVLNSSHLMRAMSAAAKAASSAKSQSERSEQGDSSKQAKRGRDGEPLGGAASSVSGVNPNPQRQAQRTGKGRGRSSAKGSSSAKGNSSAKGSTGKGRTNSKGPPSVSKAPPGN